ncbi:thiol-disulfide oxidoreductase DCC family protein [Oceanicaulis sp. LC35]|uniref:thiol-disulfide oxidoreductase DCC family protein n=1 Tax=Oceanicaulis sp. LC35 TaxID=3349635 RepID=UPI003F82C076
MALESSKPDESNPDDAVTTASVEVFYDGGCPLCRSEMSYYRARGSNAQFTDLTRGEVSPEGVSCDAALKRFHVRDETGRLRSGAAAFAALWRVTPGWRWLGRIGGVPPFVWIGEGLYRLFLPIRPALQMLVIRLSKERAS